MVMRLNAYALNRNVVLKLCSLLWMENIHLALRSFITIVNIILPYRIYILMKMKFSKLKPLSFPNSMFVVHSIWTYMLIQVPLHSALSFGSRSYRKHRQIYDIIRTIFCNFEYDDWIYANERGSLL